MSNRAPKAKKSPRKADKNKRPRVLLPFLLGLATLVGGTLSLVAFWPRPTVASIDPIDPDNPFSSRFTITNNNFVPLEDMQIGIHPQTIRMGNTQILAPSREKADAGTVFILTQPNWNHLVLHIDDSVTITPADVLGPTGAIRFGTKPFQPFQDGDLSVIVRYNPWFIPFRRAKEFRFRTRQTNGKYYWYATPAN